MVYFKWKLTLSKTTEYLSISWVTHRRVSFVPLVWSCFWHVLACSSLLWPVTGCSTIYKRQSHRMFWLTNSLKINFYKGAQVLLKAGQLFWTTNRGKWYYKVGQVIQSRALLSLLQSGATFITRWDNNYKVVQYRRQTKEREEIDFGNLLLHPILICPATDTLP